jgi:hypothetical protein
MRRIGKVASRPALFVIALLAAAIGFGGTSSCPAASGSSDNSSGCATVNPIFNNIGPLAGVSGLVYGSGDGGELYTIAPATGAVTAIGAMGHTMYDIAMYNGILYGVDATSDLYTINTVTGAATAVAGGGALGHTVNSLTFSPTGVLYAVGNNTLYTVSTATGHATTVGSGTGAGTYASSGDLEFVNGVLYLTSSTGGGGNDRLFKINTGTGQGTLVGTNLGFTNVYGLAEQGGQLYGFVNTGTTGQNILKINTTTGVGTVSGTYTLGGTPTNFGFNGTTDDAELPEPASLVLVGLGLVTLMVRSVRAKASIAPM